MKSVIKLVYVICLILVFSIFYENKNQIIVLLEKISFKILIFLILIAALRNYLESAILFLLSKNFCKNLNYFDFSNIFFKTNLTNHAVPHSGTIYRSFLLKKKGLNYFDYVFCLTLNKILRILFTKIFIIILFILFFRDSFLNFFLIYNELLIILSLILIISLVFIKISFKNIRLVKFNKYLKKFHKKKNYLNIAIYFCSIIFIEFLIFYFAFTSISLESIQLLIITYIFRAITLYIPIIQINVTHIAFMTFLSSIIGLNFIDGFLINLTTTLIGIISIMISIFVIKFIKIFVLSFKNNYK